LVAGTHFIATELRNSLDRLLDSDTYGNRQTETPSNIEKSFLTMFREGSIARKLLFSWLLTVHVLVALWQRIF